MISQEKGGIFFVFKTLPLLSQGMGQSFFVFKTLSAHDCMANSVEARL